MALTAQDRTDITDVLNLHSHRTDAGDLDGVCALLTPDVTYDMADYGLGAITGTAALRAAALALGQANPVGHHVTNIVVTPIDDHSARVRSKGLGIKADGTSDSVVYDDVVTRHPDGWKISYRRVTPRRAALGVREAGPREVLERHRRAAIDQSVEGMRAVYAADAVHEFPFPAPGVPSRLEGRDAILAWVTAGWGAYGLRFERYRETAVHTTGDPATIVVEQEAHGVSAATGPFVLPHLMVFTVRDGQVVRLRDYVNVLAAAAAIGHDL